jgi:replicative DNA helicase
MKSVPHNLEAERALLGSTILDNSMMPVLESQPAEAFFSGANRTLHSALLSLHRRNSPIDLVTIHEELTRLGKLEQVGGAAYIASLTDGVPIGNRPLVEEYARIVAEKARLRQIITVSNEMLNSALSDAESSEVILDRANGEISQMAMGSQSQSVSYRDAAIRCVDYLPELGKRRIKTGVRELDRLTGGYGPGELVIYVAETGVGKTILAEQTRHYSCLETHHSIFFSAEMPKEQLLARGIFTSASVEHWRRRKPNKLTSEEYEALSRAAAQQCPHCQIVDGPISTRTLRYESRRMAAAGLLSCIILDYDELVESEGLSEWDRLANTIKTCWTLAKELRVPAIVISQLTKVIKREDRKFPSLARLYGSHSKAKYANVVVWVDREFVQNMVGDPAAATIYVLKNRDGKIGPLPATFNLETLRFETPDAAE